MKQFDIYYCPLNHKDVSPTSWKPEVGLTFWIGQAPNLDSEAYGRRFRGFGKHDIQIRIGLIEELFEIQVVHQYNSLDCGEAGEAPSPF